MVKIAASRVESDHKPEKLSAAQAADTLLDVIDSLEISDACSFFDYAPQPIAWQYPACVGCWGFRV